MLRHQTKLKSSLLAIFCGLAEIAACLSLAAQDNRFVVFEGGKHGYINQDGVLVIPPTLQGTYVLHFSEGFARFSERVKPEPAKVPYKDKDGKLRLHPQERWGFIDTNGAVVIAAKFDAVAEFSQGLAAVAMDTVQSNHACLDCDPNMRWGFIDKTGTKVIPLQFHAVLSFSEGLAAVMNDEKKWGYINTSAELVIPFRFESARSFSEGFAPVAVNKRLGYIDKQGRFVIQPLYAIAGDFSEGLAAVRRGGKKDFMILGPAGGSWAFIGKDGKKRFRLPQKTTNARDFAEGLAAFEMEGHCGYVNKSGSVAISPVFSSCDDFSEGWADVLDRDKWKFIDKQGKVVLELAYDGVRSFKNGLAAVEVGLIGPQQEFGYIDKHGRQVWKPRPAL
jgi:hypothetical protein